MIVGDDNISTGCGDGYVEDLATSIVDIGTVV